MSEFDLVNADESHVLGAYTLKQQFVKTIGKMGRRGEKFPEDVPAEIMRAAKLWRTFMARTKKGDMRIDPGELIAMNTLAAWLIEKDAQLSGRPVPKTQWTPNGSVTLTD